MSVREAPLMSTADGTLLQTPSTSIDQHKKSGMIESDAGPTSDESFRSAMTLRQTYSAARLEYKRQSGQLQGDLLEESVQEDSSCDSPVSTCPPLSPRDRRGSLILLQAAASSVAKGVGSTKRKFSAVDVFAGAGKEHEFQIRLSTIAENVLRTGDWVAFQHLLAEVLSHIHSFEKSRCGSVSFPELSQLIHATSDTLKAQLEANDSCFLHLKGLREVNNSIQEESGLSQFKAEPTKFWKQIDEAYQFTEHREQNAERLQASLAKLVNGPRSKLLNVRRGEDDVNHVEVVSALPPELCNAVKQGISSGQLDQESCHVELQLMGVPDKAIPDLYDYLCNVAWSERCEEIVQGFLDISEGAVEELHKTAEEFEQRLEFIQGSISSRPPGYVSLKRRRAAKAGRKKASKLVNQVGANQESSSMMNSKQSVSGSGSRRSSIRDALESNPPSRRPSLAGHPSGNESIPRHLIALSAEDATEDAMLELGSRANGKWSIFGRYDESQGDLSRPVLQKAISENLGVCTSGATSWQARGQNGQSAEVMHIDADLAPQGARIGRSITCAGTERLDAHLLDQKIALAGGSAAVSLQGKSQAHVDMERTVLFQFGDMRSHLRVAQVMQNIMETASRYGKVVDIYVDPDDTNPHKATNYTGFVTFRNAADAQAAVAANGQWRILDSVVTVQQLTSQSQVVTLREASTSLGLPTLDIHLPWSGRVLGALAELQDLVTSVWKDVTRAAKFLSSCGGEIGGNGRIGILRLQQELKKERSYPCSSAEICVLFRALQVPCSDMSTLSISEFSRLARFEQWHNTQDKESVKSNDFLFGALQTRRVLMDSLTNAEKLLMQVFIALTKLYELEEDHDANAANDHDQLLLESVLDNFQAMLNTPSPREYASLVLSRCGLHIFVQVIACAVAKTPLRVQAMSIVAESVQTMHPVESESENACTFFRMLAQCLWRPLLDVVESTEGIESLDMILMQPLHKLFRQAQVPSTVVGEEVQALVPQLVSSLGRLGREVRRGREGEALRELKAICLLQAKHEIGSNNGGRADVNRLAVAFGGCHILLRLLRSFSMPTAARQLAKNILSEWLQERCKLVIRWPLPRLPRAELSKYDVLAKTIAHVDREGFPTHWPPFASTPSESIPNLASPVDLFPSSSHMAPRATERATRKLPKHSEPDPEPFSLEFAAEGIEQEVMARLKHRWERTQKPLVTQPLSARLPPAITATYTPSPQSARQVRKLHWAIEDSPPVSLGLFRRGGRQTGTRNVSDMGSRSQILSAMSSRGATSWGASPRWDSSLPQHGDLKLPPLSGAHDVC